MGLLDKPVRNSSDRFFDFNRDGRLDPNELDAQECFLHDVDTFDQILDYDEDEDEDEDDWDGEEKIKSSKTATRSYNTEIRRTTYGSPEKIINQAKLQFDKLERRKIVERAINSGVVFSLKQVASMADFLDDKLVVVAINKALDRGGEFDFTDLDYVIGEIQESTLGKIVKIWIGRKLKFSVDNLYELEGNVSDAIFAQAVLYSQENGLKLDYDCFGEFMSYMPKKQVSKAAETMLEQNYIFPLDEILDMDGYVDETVLSKMLMKYLEAGNKVPKDTLYDLNCCVSKSALTAAFLVCEEEFTPEDLDDLEMSVSKNALLEVVKRQGNILYDEYEGFSYKK